MNIEDLTLAGIASMRHLTVSEHIVDAAAFAARVGHNDRTAHRFVTALVMTNNLEDRGDWGRVLKVVMDLESAKVQEGTT